MSLAYRSLHVAYVFSLPLLACVQIAVRDASAFISRQNINTKTSRIPHWWQQLFYTGLIPTLFLLGIATVAPTLIISRFYGYATPLDHIPFLSIFFFACLIGQIGNTLTIPIRARKKSILVTKNFLIAEFLIMLGGTQFMLLSQRATPWNLGNLTLLFTIFYLLLNSISTRSLLAKEKVVNTR